MRAPTSRPRPAAPSAAALQRATGLVEINEYGGAYLDVGHLYFYLANSKARGLRLRKALAREFDAHSASQAPDVSGQLTGDALAAAVAWHQLDATIRADTIRSVRNAPGWMVALSIAADLLEALSGAAPRPLGVVGRRRPGRGKAAAAKANKRKAGK